MDRHARRKATSGLCSLRRTKNRHSIASHAGALAGRLVGAHKGPQVNLGLYEWTRRFRRDGLTPSARLELRDLLTPRVVLRPPFLPHEGDEQGSQVRIKDVVNWEIVLRGRCAYRPEGAK